MHYHVLAAGIVAGTKVIAGALLAAQVIRVFVCGFLCYGFLGYYDVSPKARVIASYCYAFNGFMMLWGQHYWLATATVWVILELLFLEKARERGRISGKIAITTAWMLMQSPYIGYMVLLFCGIYMLFRLLAEEDFCWRTFLKKAEPDDFIRIIRPGHISRCVFAYGLFDFEGLQSPGFWSKRSGYVLGVL